MKYFVYTVIGIVAISIIAGFFIVGSPATERLRKFDERRVNDLQNIQWQIVNYWQNKQQLPQNLALLNDDISGFRVPMDPQGGGSYEYQATGQMDFALCGTFSLAEDSSSQYPQPMMYGPKGAYAPDSWAHSAGRMCFDRHIDKDTYPPRVPALK